MSNTPYMNLVLPTVGVTIGPDYATENNTAFTTVDSHNHTSGQGVQIPTLGININADLSCAAFNITNLRSTRYSNQVAALALATDLACVYFAAGELYANDTAGNQVKITSGGSVNVSGSGNITGMGATTAAVTYTSGNQTFTFTSNTVVPATLDIGTLTIRESGASSPNGISIFSPSALSASYNLILPTTISSTNNALIMSSNAGVLSYLALGSAYQVPQVNSGGTALTYGSVRRNSLASVGQQISTSSGTFTSSGTSQQDVTNLTVTITTTGRPVFLGLQPDGTSNLSFISMSTTGHAGNFHILRDVTEVSQSQLAYAGQVMPPGWVWFLDTPVGGTYTYKVQVKAGGGGANLNVFYCNLVAYEL